MTGMGDMEREALLREIDELEERLRRARRAYEGIVVLFGEFRATMDAALGEDGGSR